MYTVAWICASHIELLAAKMVLDENHGKPQDQSFGDRNSYELGMIDGHFIVIVTLPFGSYGSHSTNTVADELQMTFKNIRLRLMVGTGGGIPSARRDIRLGDVVVSTPSRGADGACAGIVYYMRGNKVDGIDGLKELAPPVRPPFELLTAVSVLRSNLRRVKSLYTETIQHCFRSQLEILYHSEKDGLQPWFHPGAEKDVLFAPDYPHSEGSPDFSGCDRRRVIPRKPRADENPHVHYGGVASGDILVKDAEERDRIGRRFNAICVEMEAAGLQHFPSIVIRGISNYADSHKNDHWQRYAALTAAAYARELLCRIAIARDKENFSSNQFQPPVYWSPVSNTSTLQGQHPRLGGDFSAQFDPRGPYLSAASVANLSSPFPQYLTPAAGSSANLPPSLSYQAASYSRAVSSLPIPDAQLSHNSTYGSPFVQRGSVPQSSEVPLLQGRNELQCPRNWPEAMSSPQTFDTVELRQLQGSNNINSPKIIHVSPAFEQRLLELQEHYAEEISKLKASQAVELATVRREHEAAFIGANDQKKGCPLKPPHAILTVHYM